MADRKRLAADIEYERMVNATSWGVGVYFDQTGANQRRWQMQRPSRRHVERTPEAQVATLARLAARFPTKVRPIH
jgi:hypothetical protein